jgi:hypothetical protein
LEAYKNITEGKVKFPTNISKEAKSLIKGLLQLNKMKRLGNLLNGIDDIKEHKFFKGIFLITFQKR